MEKQKSILKKLLYIIIVMMLCWIYNGYNRSLEYLISSADIDWRYIYAKESNVNPLDYMNNTIYNIKRPSIKHTLKLADKKWCEYALSHSINPDDYVCDKIKYDEDNYIFVYKNVNNINTATYDIMLKRNHYVFKKGTYVNYYPNGNIKEIYHKKNGELTDKYTMFHENGRIAIVGYYENDEKTGEWKEYDNNGKLYKNYQP